MKPKSHKEFKKGIADEIGIHPSVVDEFVAFYYSKVRQALSSLEDTKVFVDGLGTFAVRKAKLEKAIIKNKSYLGDLNKNTYKGYGKAIDIEKKIKVLQNTLDKVEENLINRKQFKENKNATK